MEEKVPQSVDEMDVSPWFTAADLKGMSVAIEIVDAVPKKIKTYDREEQAWIENWQTVLTIKSIASGHVHEKLVITNKTQRAAIAKITGNGLFSTWIGCNIVLAPGKTKSGKDTIDIKKYVGN